MTRPLDILHYLHRQTALARLRRVNRDLLRRRRLIR
jgi:hypothetical protein